MSRPRLLRRRRWFERGLGWLVLGTGAALAAFAAALVSASGLLREYELFPPLLRGYTPLGTLLGLGAAGASLGTLLYSLRRRPLQETMPLGRGTMAMWLWGHVTFGSLALLFALAHGGYGVLSLQPTTGKVLFYLLVVSALSGLVWRVIYAFVPRAAARSVGNYSAEESLLRARAQQVEIEKLAAGRSATLQALANQVLATRLDAAEAGRAAAQLSPSDSATFAEIARLAGERHDALARAQKQRRYVARLQGLRVVHVPLSLIFIVVLPLHVLLAYDVPERLLAQSAAGAALGGFEPAATCERCHARVVAEWRTSMHAHGLTGPVMVAQSNIAARTTLSELKAPDPKNLCINCHGPVAARIAPQATLPLPSPALGDPDLTSEGITCVVCHTFAGEAQTGGAALTAFQHALTPGRTYAGPYEEPVGNAFHRSVPSAEFVAPERLCQNCHSVVYDRDGDGRIEKGKDLVLQDLFSEWQAYRASGGAHCIDCHMPELAPGRAAEAALIPFEQDEHAPPRRLRSHRFIGPDFPLDDPSARNAGRAEREALLKRAATLTLEPGSLAIAEGKLRVRLSVTNTGAGHNLPGGFAFVRQMWVELKLLDAQGRLISGSGVIGSVADDLCDPELLAAGRSLRNFAGNCASVDNQLVTFQQRLLDRVQPARDASGAPRKDARGQAVLEAAPGADEVVVQHVTSGPVARVRGSDKRPIPPLIPGESRSFDYSLDAPAAVKPARLEARLLFRAVPPYFLRAMAARQEPADGPRVDTFIQNLEVIEMARASATLPSR
ncbi:MAG TPA: multiheme c-type cytochrome [Polyangiaceae bacterium]|nr:multiheme c-type cytochrome [Polyangiaceae bacterium]